MTEDQKKDTETSEEEESENTESTTDTGKDTNSQLPENWFACGITED